MPRPRPRSTRATHGCGSKRVCDAGTFAPITADDASGVLAGVGRMHGTPVVVFCSDATIQGGAMGTAGCLAIVAAYERALADDAPIVGLWHSGGARLREGVESLRRGRPGVRRDDPRVGQGAADLGGARPGGWRRGVRPGADRHRHHGAGRPHLRHRPRRRPQRHRRGRRHGEARRRRGARPPQRRRAHHHGLRGGRVRPQPARSPSLLGNQGTSGRRGDRRRRPRRAAAGGREARLRRAPAGRRHPRRSRRRAARQVGTEHRHRPWAGSAGAPSG